MTKRSYARCLDDMGKLLLAGMPRTDRERDELVAAEAEVRRLKTQLAVAEERESLARERYGRERAVLHEMFDTWKAEVTKVSAAGDQPCPCGAAAGEEHEHRDMEPVE